MLRALSVRRDPHRYEKLGEEPAVCLLEGELKRAKSVPAKVFGSPKAKAFPDNAPAKPTKKTSKTHPLFTLFDTRRKKKTTARPEFTRYLEYVKEGGLWDVKSNMPVIYYK